MALSLERQIERDHWLLISYHLALANSGILDHRHANGALDNWFQREEQKLPLCLTSLKADEPPPPNWKDFWRRMVRR